MTANLLALVAATLVLVAIPGPNIALIVANSLRFGLSSGMTTVFGTTLGVAVQLALVVLGMAALIEVAADALQWIRWAGVAYLVWLGIRTWRTPPEDLDANAEQPAVFWHGVMIATLNPKTLLFNAAFIPQFVPAGGSAADAMLVAAVFLTVLMAGDTLWAVFANSARGYLDRAANLRNRVTGAFLVLAGIGLALARGRD